LGSCVPSTPWATHLLSTISFLSWLSSRLTNKLSNLQTLSRKIFTIWSWRPVKSWLRTTACSESRSSTSLMTLAWRLSAELPILSHLSKCWLLSCSALVN
jgi:hypothetical protein